MNKNKSKEMGYAKDREVIIKSVEVDTSQYNSSEIRRISFITDRGPITWKPKVRKVQLMDGIKINKVMPMEIGDIPKEVTIIGDRINSEGKVKAMVEYTTMKTTDSEGKDVIYRFITSIETLKKWTLSDNTPKQETITD